jgi:hypothetical protein
MSVVNVEPIRTAEWLVDEWDERYTRTYVTFRNATGATRDFPSGQTLKLSSGKYHAADGVSAMAILMEPVYDLANNTDTTAAVLIRGPALVNVNRLTFELSSTDPDTDPDVTAQIASLAALSPPIIAVDEGSVIATL